jgi:hypothetical protein
VLDCALLASSAMDLLLCDVTSLSRYKERKTATFSHHD